MPNQFQNPNPQDPNNQNPFPGNGGGVSNNNNDPYSNYDYNNNYNNQYTGNESYEQQPNPNQGQGYDNSGSYNDPYQNQNNNQDYNNYNDPYQAQGGYADSNAGATQNQNFAPDYNQGGFGESSQMNNNNFPDQGYNAGYNNQGYNNYNEVGQDSYANNNSGYQDPNYNGYNTTPNQDFTPQSFDNAGIDENDPNNPNNPNNTFIEKKSGNSKFLIFSVILIVILLIISGIMFYVNFGDSLFNNNENDTEISQIVDDNSNEDNDTDQDEANNTGIEAITDSMTGGVDTPATKSRENSDTSLSQDWIIKKFSITYRDNEGNCEFDNYCGPNADPDEDGLENIYEYNFGLDPMDSDVDNDGLSDGDELFVYYTNPKTSDSDGDTYKDNEELLVCTDPTIDGEYYSDVRLQEITSKISLFPLHKDTLLTLGSAEGADEESITRDGYLQDACNTKSEDGETGSALDQIENAEDEEGVESSEDTDSDNKEQAVQS